jgi:hypothetical protein
VTGGGHPHGCESAYCTVSAPYWSGPIIAAGPWPAWVTGHCDGCRVRVCGRCSWPVELLPGEWSALGQADVARLAAAGHPPVWLHCLKCGVRLGLPDNVEVHVVAPVTMIRIEAADGQVATENP